MNRDSQPDGADKPPAPAEDLEATRLVDKATVPPPAFYETEGEEDEHTVLARIPEELIAESAQPAPKPAKGGLRQMFSRDPAPLRHVLPTEDEGDALLDMLFSDPNAPPGPPKAGRAKEAAPKEAAPKEAAPKEAAPKEAAPKEAAPKEAAPKEAARDEGADDGVVTSAAPLKRPAGPPPCPAGPPRPAAGRPPAAPPRATPVSATPAPASATPAPAATSAAPPRATPAPVSATPAPSSALAEPAPEEPVTLDPSSVDLSDEPTHAVEPVTSEPLTLEPLTGEADAQVGQKLRELEAAAEASRGRGGGQRGDPHPGLVDRSAPFRERRRSRAGGRQPAARGHPAARCRRARRPAAAAPAAPPAEAAVDDEHEMVDDLVDESQIEMEAEAPLPPPVAARPAPIASRPPGALAFDREEDANAQLLRTHQREAWVARAEWLRAEATAHTDKPARARALLTVAELFAMAGEEATARAILGEVRELAPAVALAHTGLRGLLSRDADWAGILEVLDAEGRVVPPLARTHGALFGAEIGRLCLADGDGARKRTEQALRVSPGDPRAHVQRFAEALGAAEADDRGASPLLKVRVPEEAELRSLGEAFARVAAYRGLAAAGAKAAGPAFSSYEALLRARAALEAGDVGAAIDHVEAAGSAPTLAGGAGWLTSVLAAPRKETRARAAAALRGRLGGSHPALARRALAARAIELGDAESARAAADTEGSEAFSPADRIALAALTGGGVGDIAPWIESVSADAELAPIAAAASAAMQEPTAEERHVHAAGSLRARLATTLGRALAGAEAGGGALTSGVLAFGDAEPESGLARALSLELDLEAGAGGRIARTVSAWNDEPGGERDRALAGALLAEAAGEAERARADYEKVLASDPALEVVARAASVHAEAEGAARILASHAEALEPGPRAAVLLTEAAIRHADTGDDETSERLLKRAAEVEPKLPFAPSLGERSARARGDREGLIDWLKARRESSDDLIEQAHDLVREAMLVTEDEGGQSAALLEQALRARPRDAGLRELYERLSAEPPEDRASWRAERAAEATGVEAARLALEAALDLERSGDFEDAARCARQAIAAGENLLAPMCAYRVALAGHGSGDLVDALLPQARETTDGAERLEIYERLAELDERGRGDTASGLLWRRTILEEVPGHLPTLRKVASTLIAGGRDEELEPIALEIARTLEGPESTAHAMLSARLRLHFNGWDQTGEPVEIAYRNSPRGSWALRQMSAHARAQQKFAIAYEVDRQLIERTQRPSEAATLSLRAGESALRAEQVDDAVAFFVQARDLAPAHLRAHLELADALGQSGNHAGAAAALEAAAEASVTPAERVRNLYQAAILWNDQGKDVARARADLESVFELDSTHQDVFARLQAIYVAEGARAELADLLKRRLDAVTDPAERVEMEVLRGRALADVGDAATAKRALAAALEANPDHVEALAAFGDVSATEQDWSGAEQAWIRLARLVPDADRQAAIYLRLGELYDEHLPNQERAELAYQEILKRSPADTRARERLVALYQRAGDAGRAIEQQTVLINAAEAPEAKCQRTTELGAIYEAAGELKKAESTLLQARKTWPKDEVALAALARFYQRANQQPAANVLLDRAVADARRALSTGRFEPYLFSTVATVADLRGRPDAAAMARAAVASLEGGAAELDGAGASAGSADLDELLAPEVITPAFRDLLLRTGSLLDAAVPYDVSSTRATPLPPQQAGLGDLIRTLAGAYGLPGVQVHVSAALGAVCIPATAHPPTVVLGQALVASTRDDVRGFLIHRALKVIQTNTAAFSRTAPIDLWPLLAAYLKAFNASWSPPGIDPAKLTDFYGRISRAMPKGIDMTAAGALATEVIGSIGNRASTLNSVVNGWGNRTGLLAVGDLNVALTGIAWAGGHANAPPPTGKDRTTWIGRNVEARELVVFSVSDAFADARTKVGVGS